MPFLLFANENVSKKKIFRRSDRIYTGKPDINLEQFAGSNF